MKNKAVEPLYKQARKGFSASKCDVGNLISSKLGTFREIVWKFFGFFRDFLGGIFWIFLEEFFGKIFCEDFLGGFFWEEFFVYIVKVS